MHFTFNGSARKKDYQSLFEIYGNKIPMPKMSLKFRAKRHWYLFYLACDSNGHTYILVFREVNNLFVNSYYFYSFLNKIKNVTKFQYKKILNKWNFWNNLLGKNIHNLQLESSVSYIFEFVYKNASFKVKVVGHITYLLSIFVHISNLIYF